MGFMDKLKDAGKSALKGAMALASTTYGTVVSGKYAEHKIGGLGAKRDSLTFAKGPNALDPISINENIKTFAVEMDSDATKHYTFKMFFNDGETSVVKVNVDQNKTSVPEQYMNAALLVTALALNVQEEPDEKTKFWVDKIMQYAKKPTIYFK